MITIIIHEVDGATVDKKIEKLIIITEIKLREIQREYSVWESIILL